MIRELVDVSFTTACRESGDAHEAKLAEEGFGAYILFVIQMEGVKWLYPNDATDKPFGEALRKAKNAGVEILTYDCKVTVNTMEINEIVEVKL